MRIIDLTHEAERTGSLPVEVKPYPIPVKCGGQSYEAVCYKLALDGMSGTYWDLPGHLRELNDGQDAANVPLEKLAMRDATVIHLQRDRAEREVTAAELERAGTAVRGDVLIIHALGKQDWRDFPVETIPYFGRSAIEWIVRHPIRHFASDIYEKSGDLQGIFPELFRRGICTVCHPINLSQLRQTYSKACIVPMRLKGVMQLPCRFFVVEE